MGILRLALDQITRPTWWNEKYDDPHGHKARDMRAAERRKYIMAYVRTLTAPVPLRDVAARLNVPSASVGGLLSPEIEAGRVRRTVINNIVHLQYIGEGEP